MKENIYTNPCIVFFKMNNVNHLRYEYVRYYDISIQLFLVLYTHLWKNVMHVTCMDVSQMQAASHIVPSILSIPLQRD